MCIGEAKMYDHWAASLGQKVFDSWEAHSKAIGGEAIAERVKANIRNAVEAHRNRMAKQRKHAKETKVSIKISQE
jgi:hypothetical protein